MDPFRLWQLADSAFPTGGFAHSGGLEAAVQLGVARGADDVERLAAEVVWAAAALALPFVDAAHRAPAALPALDRRCDALLSSHVANRASRAQGEALLRAAAAAFAAEVGPLAARARGLALHHAPVHGVVCAALGAGRDEARRLFLFGALRGVVSAAVRLGVCGPLEAQALQARVAAEAEAAAQAPEAPPEDAAQTNPVLELVQGHQDRLYSRLFRS